MQCCCCAPSATNLCTACEFRGGNRAGTRCIRALAGTAGSRQAVFAVSKASPEPSDEAISRLAALSLAEYEQCRIGEAQRLGWRVAVLDSAILAVREKASPAKGRGVTLSEPVPWPYPVSTADLLDELVSGVSRHVVLSISAVDAIALWIAHTWVYVRFEHTPRLAITSPTRRCGKSTLLDVLAATCFRALKTDNVTTAAIFRIIEALRPLTLLIDEADSFLTRSDELRGVLNSGCERSGLVIRVEEQDGKYVAVPFATYAPAALAAIRDLPSTLNDRSVPIRPQRKAAHETVVRLRALGARAALAELARKLARWAADEIDALALDPPIPDEFGDREGDIAVPLLAIADLAGPAWADRGRRALLQLWGLRPAEEGEEAGTLPLEDLRTLFVDRRASRLPTREIIVALARLEERPWPEWCRGKTIRPWQLAALLRPFGIHSRDLKLTGGQVLKGYDRSDFEDTWNRYLGVSAGTERSPIRYRRYWLERTARKSARAFRYPDYAVPNHKTGCPQPEQSGSGGRASRMPGGAAEHDSSDEIVL